ncbi:MAG: hypothetical protein KBF83_01135 [Pyrinomonadaceae bacterium]|nr:hypothetical protein [Acidobacteriota bacterium]MBP7473612.1 hypothetical protein [Pyrinomonadaceae bacterium]MBP9108136.1 hypothetical protein [Pyrinomonadaceae bacterium]
MNTCCTCSTHAKTFSLGKSQTDLNPTRSPGEKLEFVEHVLGVLIDSRHGDGNPYQRLGEATVMTGHSQMFANVRLLSAAEIQTHLEFGGAHHRPFYAALLGKLPLASASGSWQQNISGFSPTLFWAKAREVLEVLIRRLKPTAIQRTQNDHSFMPRGSPTFLGRVLFQPS